MKSPADLRVVLRRQWENATWRESRLLGGPDAWPISLHIGKPSPQRLRADLEGVKRHVETWRRISTGTIVWKPIRYRQAADPVSIPIAWQLSKPTEWIEAIGDRAVEHEFHALAQLVVKTPANFHPTFVCRRSLWAGKAVDEVVKAANLATMLAPGSANGRPLRMLGMEGIDTKFFERHAALITALLDVRYEGEVGKIGLEGFLGAYQEGDHWLLIMDLDGGLLPFRTIRVRSSDLRETPLPGELLLVVENEACQHLLPRVSGAIAVLGTGFDLNWIEGEWLSSRKVAYWGDIDTWGLQCLARARSACPQTMSLMMTEDVYHDFSRSRVAEPIAAGRSVPVGLNSAEASLYCRLLSETQNRLEQEFLTADFVETTILAWAQTSRTL